MVYKASSNRFAKNLVNLFTKTFAYAFLLAPIPFIQQEAQAADIIPGYTTTCPVPNPCIGYTAGTTPTSWGFFFETLTSVPINALGFSSQPEWQLGTTPYTVTLWSYNNGGVLLSDFTPLASKQFVYNIGYQFKDGYFWQPLLKTITLPESKSKPNSGYVIAAIGDFSQSPGNSGYEITTTSNFNPNFEYAFNGTNPVGPTDPAWPIPYYEGADINGVPYTNAFFNANFSVPGPLPAFGVAATVVWSRRLKKRIRSVK